MYYIAILPSIVAFNSMYFLYQDYLNRKYFTTEIALNNKIGNKELMTGTVIATKIHHNMMNLIPVSGKVELRRNPIFGGQSLVDNQTPPYRQAVRYSKSYPTIINGNIAIGKLNILNIFDHKSTFFNKEIIAYNVDLKIKEKIRISGFHNKNIHYTPISMEIWKTFPICNYIYPQIKFNGLNLIINNSEDLNLLTPTKINYVENVDNFITNNKILSVKLIPNNSEITCFGINFTESILLFVIKLSTFST